SRLRGTITLGSEISITDVLTINGPGSNDLTVSGAGTTRVFAISGATTSVTITKLTIADGLAKGDTVPDGAFGPVTLGGGSLNQGGHLSLTQVVMKNNQVVGSGAELSAGGALANVFAATLTATQCTFLGNSAQGASTTGGGAILNDVGSTAVIDHCAFKD